MTDSLAIMPSEQPNPAAPTPGLQDRLLDAASRVREAAIAASRPAGSVQLLLATKTIAAAVVLEVIAAGFGLIGENRAQEVVAKADELAAAGLPYDCHFIGHLQRNKVNQVLPHVSCVQTVDSVELGGALDRRTAELGRMLDVFVQVNVSGEASKYGISLSQAPGLLDQLKQCRALRVRGFMTIGLNSADLAAVRAGYRSLAAFRDDAQARGLPGAEHAVELSMGMSGDFAAAIAEGATMVRLGSAVFGPRPPQPPAADLPHRPAAD